MSRRLQNLPPLSIVEPPPPPQKWRLDTNSSFESPGVSESPWEPELCYTQPNPLSVEIEYLQAQEFARNYNSPLIYLRDLVLVQVRQLGPLGIGLPLSSLISSLGEGLEDMPTPISSMLASGVSPSPMNAPGQVSLLY